MTLKLNGSSSGYTAIDAPAAAGSNTLVLPTNNGSANQVLKTDGSGNLSFTGNTGLFDAYAIICDRKAANTHGGTFTQDAWRTRDLNHEIADPSGIVSISSNQFTLQAGTYLIKWRAPYFRCNDNQTQLYNVTDSSTAAEGFQANGNTNDGDSTYAFGIARITISGAKAFEIQHQCTSTKADNGFGLYAYNIGSYSFFTMVEIWRES